MDNKAIIIELANQLEPGTTIRERCPRCNGGTSNELSLSITLGEDTIVYWNCFRASCEEKGTTATLGLPATTMPKKRRRVFDGQLRDLEKGELDRIRTLWGITDPPYWWWTDSLMGRVAMSIRSPKYVHRGWVLRDINNRSLTKALTYVDEGEEGISWYKTTPGAPTVVVEDIPSAVRAMKYVNAVALCGTGVGLSRAEEIAEHASRPVIVALDQDATKEAFRIAHKWALLWGDVKVLPLRKDMKNTEEKELCELLHY